MGVNCIIFKRAKFNSRSQRARESVDSFITDLYGQARYCNFGALKEENRIVMGLQNRKLLEKLQLDLNLTLQKATNLVRQERDGQTTTKHSLPQCTLMASQKLHHGKTKETSKRNRKASLKRNLNSDSYKDKNAHQKCQWCLGKLHPKKTCPAHFSKGNKCSKLFIGCRLVKVQNQEKYLKLLKKKNLSF